MIHRKGTFKPASARAKKAAQAASDDALRQLGLDAAEGQQAAPPGGLVGIACWLEEHDICKADACRCACHK